MTKISSHIKSSCKSKFYLFAFFINTDTKQFLQYFTVDRYIVWIHVTPAFNNFFGSKSYTTSLNFLHGSPYHPIDYSPDNQ